MLSIPWFVTSTLQDLFRWRPQPRVDLAASSPQQVTSSPQQITSPPQQVEEKKTAGEDAATPQHVTGNTSSARVDRVTPNLPGANSQLHVQEKTELTQTKASPNLTAAKAKVEVKQETQTEPARGTVKAAEQVTRTSSKTIVLAPTASEGKMSLEWAKQQVEKFKFDFDDADKDKSGSLSFNEVYQVLKKVGFNGSEQEAQFIFGHLDRDSDKKVSREEFEASMKNLPRLTIKEFCLRKAFLQLDKDKSGYLTKEEIEDATKTKAGLDISAEKIADLLIYLCKEDKDQKVSYEEFLRVFGVHQEATVMRQIFVKLDADHSGFLSKEEILAAVKSEFELKLKASKISDLLCYWCKDEDKKISYEEFVNVWTKQETLK